MKGNPKMAFAVMIEMRLMLCFGASYIMQVAVRQATRYAACRRQFRTIPGSKEERKLIDYQTHMAVLAPNLATAIVLNLASLKVRELNNQSKAQIASKNDYSMLDLLHHLTSGFKAFSTDAQYRGVDELRQACGGAGFLLASGIASIWIDGSPNVTIDGVSVLMYQQSSRYLLKQLKKREKGEQLKNVFSYLNNAETLLGSKCPESIKEFLSLPNLTHTLKVRAAFFANQTYRLLSSS
jgi:acyl-CoA oxidase